MGYRLHVQKKHIIEYSDGAFNGGFNEINGLLNATCDGIFNTEDPLYADEIEINREDLKKLYFKTLQGTDEQIKKALSKLY